MFEALLKTEGINVNVRNADGDTAAMVAAANYHQWMIERLSSVPQFDADVRNFRGETLNDVQRALAALETRTLSLDLT
jgi:hypothetical protein